MSEHKPLSPPPSLPPGEEGLEMIRFWIAGNQDHASLRVGYCEQPEQEASMWGFMLADTAKHFVDAFKELHPDGPDKTQLMKELITAFMQRMQYGPSPESQSTVKGRIE